MRSVDLRSDTVTRPTIAMLEALRNADVGAYVYGDDPEADALECEVAELLGKAAATFVPTTTMGNQIALLLHSNPGDVFLVPGDAHAAVSEGGAPGALAGAMPVAVESRSGVIDPDALEAMLENRARRISYQTPRVSLLWIENTHARAGGTVVPGETMRRYEAIAQAHGLKVHVDASRIVHAAVCTGESSASLSRQADTVVLTLNKCLGAPVGAVLAGEDSMIEEARRVRQRLGGGWRKPGHLAAAARVALRTPDDVIAMTHEMATALAAPFDDAPSCRVDPPQTNIVHAGFPTPDTAARFVAEVGKRGVRCGLLPPDTVRLVTHPSLERDDIRHAAEAIKACVGVAS